MNRLIVIVVLIFRIYFSESCSFGDSNLNMTPSSADDYRKLAVELSSIYSNLPSIDGITTELNAALNPGLLESSTNSDWSAVRTKKSRIIFTNIIKLEHSLKQSGNVTNIHFVPPDVARKPGPGFSYNDGTLPDEFIADATGMELTRAYRAASGAHSALINEYQKMTMLSNNYLDRSIDFVAQAYSLPPHTKVDLSDLLRLCPSCDCTMQLSNQVYRLAMPDKQK